MSHDVDPGCRTRSFELNWRARFERFGQSYQDDARIAGWSEHGLATRVRYFQRAWSQPPAGGVWLDAGCGAGTYSRLLAGDDLRVVGLDYSLPSLRKARGHGPPHISWLAGDSTRLPVPDSLFDGALCFGVAQSLAAPQPLIDELGRVLRPGGDLWIDVLNLWCAPTLLRLAADRIQARPHRLRYDSRRRLARSLRSAGFRVVRWIWLPILPGPLRRLQPLVDSPVGRLLFRFGALASLFSHGLMVHARKERT